MSSGAAELTRPERRQVTLPAGRLLVLDTTYFLPCTTIAVGVLSLGNVAALSSEDVDAGTVRPFSRFSPRRRSEELTLPFAHLRRAFILPSVRSEASYSFCKGGA